MPAAAMIDFPKLVLKSGHDKRLRTGSPWVFANEVELTADLRALPAGSLVRLALPSGRVFGLVHLNPHALIVARLLTRNADASVDATFFRRRIERALALRELLLPGGYYRLIHGEADGLPGLIVDRFGDTVVVQPNTAGMDASLAAIVEALEQALAPTAIVIRADSRSRSLEGLPTRPTEVRGDLDQPIEVREGDLVFRADPVGGQKTGWFFDQRPNRAIVRSIAGGRRVLDLYSYSGAFAVQTLAGGAACVVAVDRAVGALELARDSAAAAGFADRFETTTGDAFDVVGGLTEAKQRFDLVVCDPPPFAPSKKDAPAARRAYRKLARAATGVIAAEGFLAMASCSHHVAHDDLLTMTFHGLRDAGRSGRLLYSGGAGPDHPLHPGLPESRYLSFLLLALD